MDVKGVKGFEAIVFVSAGGSTVRLVKNDQEDGGPVEVVKDVG